VSERLDTLRAEIAALEAAQRLRDLPPLLRAAAELTAAEEGEESSAHVAALNELGSLLRTLKELDESDAVFRRGAGLELEARGRTADYATCINNLAGTLRLKGSRETAEELFREALEIYEAQVGTKHFVYLSALNNLGLVYQDMKKYEEAERLHYQALVAFEEGGSRNAAYATTLNNLASVAMATGRYAKAEEYLERALELYRETAGGLSVLYLTGLNNLAAACYLAGDYARAEAFYSQALTLIERVLGTDHPDYARASRSLARARERLRETEGGDKRSPGPA
jgi:tetratricopeptide (TPR) repeat protein